MVDYSCWNRIEISDDEDDTHPNIDTGSLFRWRHQARLERMEKQRKLKQDLEAKCQEIEDKLAQISHLGTQEEKEQVLEQKRQLDLERAEMEHRERLQPWNIDTISHDSWSKTLINRKCLQEQKYDDVSNNSLNDANSVELKEFSDEQQNRYASFVERNETKIRKFAFHSHFDDCRRFLLENTDLVCQHSLDYLMLWCLQLKLDEKHDLFNHIAKQSVILQMILDLAKTVSGTDPRDCLPTFFTKARNNWQKFQKFWEQEVCEFKQRIQTATEHRIERAIQEQMESNEKLIGPGGLDAQEVFDSLPQELQECFEKRNVAMLEERLSKMEPEQAEYHMQRCVDAGLWLTEKNSEYDKDERLLKEIIENQKQDKQMENDDDEEENSD